jgi:transcriptional regulator with XRE-family HTH domain
MRRVTPARHPSDPSIVDAMSFGAAVRAARTAAGVTLVDAATTLGVAKQTLSDLESGRGSVALSTALRLAHSLGVAVFAVPSIHREPVRRLIVSSHATGSESGPREDL